jgi:biotin carboxylase
MRVMIVGAGSIAYRHAAACRDLVLRVASV